MVSNCRLVMTHETFYLPLVYLASLAEKFSDPQFCRAIPFASSLNAGPRSLLINRDYILFQYLFGKEKE